MNCIGVLTSGGDAPGMNACVRAVVRTAIAHNLQVKAVLQGFDGVMKCLFQEMRARDVGGIIQKGGTILQTARSKEFTTPEGLEQGLKNLKYAGIDGLVVIGGDGSMRGCLALHQRGFPVVGVPASIDNDIWGTNMAIGVDTALNTIVQAIDKLRDTASSHKRAFLVETMGRRCGYLALMSGVIGGAEMILIPEVETPLEEVAETIAQAYTRGKTHAIIVVAEGARHNAAQVEQWLNDHAPTMQTRVTILGHVQRGGQPTAFDRLLAARLGMKAIEALVKGEMGKMTALGGREISLVPLEEVTAKQREANLEYHRMAKMLAK
ncbi:MAG TPA: 6-phosphofructokinase [Anaerolineales bacterium]|nr:6-phosphofructokinase [Anaerolineales bacterium]